ncbi:hypothetical protein FRC02_006068 [Tulasnella sp. 418]|nr:hypothetical protein FRC02_006068 [Tulasnella sp. 418]
MGVTERRKERMKEKREEFEEDRSEIAEERKWIAEIRDKIARQREQIGRYRGVIARSKDSTSQSEILELPMPEGLLVRRMNEREKELGLVEWRINLYEGYLNRKEVRLKRQELKVNLEEEEMNQRDKALEPELKELNQRMDDVNQLKEDIRSMKEQVRALKEINRQNSAQIIGYSPDGGLFRYAPAPEHFNARKLNPVASAEWETRWEPSSFPYLCIEKFNASCVICQGDFAEPLQTLGECSASTEVAEEAPELLRQLPCRHVFHRVCIDDMLQNSSRSCPVCRRRVDKEFIQHVYASEDMSDEDGSWENIP